MERPLRLTAHGGFGEGDGETRLSEGGKVRPVPTLQSGGRGRDSPSDYNIVRRTVFEAFSLTVKEQAFATTYHHTW
jgi:hypothetical protein